MNHRILAGILSFGVLLAMAFGFVFLNTQSDFACRYFTCWSSFYYVDVVFPFTRQIWPLALLFFALIFVRREVFYIWFKLFVPFAAIAIWLVINSATITGGWFAQIYPNRQEMTHFTVNFLVYGSAVLVIAIHIQRIWKLKRGNSKPSKHL